MYDYPLSSSSPAFIVICLFDSSHIDHGETAHIHNGVLLSRKENGIITFAVK